MLILFLNFNQILNLDYYILCSSDKGVITPLNRATKDTECNTSHNVDTKKSKSRRITKSFRDNYERNTRQT